MLRGMLESSSIFDLPVIATLLFVAIFATVLLRVCQRARQPEYRHMSTLPLADDGEPAANDTAHDQLEGK